MSHQRGALGNPDRPKPKRLRTKRERDAAKFGPKLPLWGSRRGPPGRPRWLQPRPWGGLLLGSPLAPPKPVVITQKRLCHRGIFNREVKSLDVRRLLTPGPGGDGALPAPHTQEGNAGGVPAEPLKELVASLASLLGSLGAFLGRDLVSERRRGLLAVLRRHRRGPPDLRVFLARQRPASRRSPRREATSGAAGRAVSLGVWEAGDPPAGTPSPLRAVDTPPPPPRTPSHIFGARGERENPFPWSSAEEEDATPGGLPQPWGGPGGLPPAAPPFWGSPKPRQEEEEDGGDEGWTPVTPPAWGPPKPRDTRGPPRAPRRPQAPKIWGTELPWDPPGASGSPWNAPIPPHTPQLWSPRSPKAFPDPLRHLWDPPNPSRPPLDPHPWSPELPRPALDPPRVPRTPQLWNPEPPRALWDPQRPPWDSLDAPRAPLNPPRSPRTPQLWSLQPPWDPPAAPRPSRDHRPWDPRDTEPSRCRCHRRLCRDTAPRQPLCHPGHTPLCRDMPPPQRQPPKRRRPDWGGVLGGSWGRGSRGRDPPSPLPPVGCSCPCRGLCWGGGDLK